MTLNLYTHTYTLLQTHIQSNFLINIYKYLKSEFRNNQTVLVFISWPLLALYIYLYLTRQPYYHIPPPPANTTMDKAAVEQSEEENAQKIHSIRNPFWIDDH